MKNLRTRINRFFLRNRDKGIPNLMLYLSIGSAIVYLMTHIAGNMTLYSWLCFDRDLILRGQVWRLFTYALTYGVGNSSVLLVAISLFCYFSLGTMIERTWGTLRFNLFYLTGIVLMDIFCMIFPLVRADVYYLNLSLLLSYATLFPDAQFLFFFIIPVRAWIFALIDLALVLVEVITLSVPVFLFPYNLFPLLSIANYFLFFGKDVANVLPPSWRMKLRKKSKPAPQGNVIIFSQKGPYKTEKPNYTHKCTVCGRTDVDSPDLEFRYCSRCKGYHCYCSEHISNHTHVE